VTHHHGYSVGSQTVEINISVMAAVIPPSVLKWIYWSKTKSRNYCAGFAESPKKTSLLATPPDWRNEYVTTSTGTQDLVSFLKKIHLIFWMRS
jgi:hypothetical protein